MLDKIWDECYEEAISYSIFILASIESWNSLMDFSYGKTELKNANSSRCSSDMLIFSSIPYENSISEFANSQ